MGSAARWGPLGLVTAVALGSTLATGPTFALAQEDNGPEITSATVSPSSLPAAGGTITIVVEAVDDVGIAAASASMYSPDGASDGVELTRTGPTTFTGTYPVPPNGAEYAVQWGVEIWVTDADGGAASAFTGGVEVEAQPQFDEAPLLWDLALDPPALPATGGTVTISARAWDLRGISGSSATITGPGGEASSVELQPVAADRFEGVFVAPPNLDDVVRTSEVTIAVQDDIGQETRASAGTFEVAGGPATSPGTLAIAPRLVVLGPVRTGGTATATVLVRNTSPAGAAPIVAVVAVAGRGFSLADGGAFTSAPGEVTTLRITFSAGRAGAVVGAVGVVRADGAQPALGAVLIGVAVPRRR